MANKAETISRVYYAPEGFGSITETLKAAQKYDPTISYKDVREWKANQEENQRKKQRGFNSFIVDEPLEEYQMDLMFFNDLPNGEDNSICLLMVDIFTKWTQIVLTKSKTVPDILKAIKECLNLMNGKPKLIYSDNEGAFNSNEVQKFFKREGIQHITTLNHAAVAERQIRTMKDMIYKRLEYNAKDKVPTMSGIHGPPLQEIIDQVIQVYNNVRKQRIIKMTPTEACKPENLDVVRTNLELSRRSNRTYPKVSVGDQVRVLKKKDKLDKERVSNWTLTKYRVESIETIGEQNFYKISGHPRLISRAEILLVN